MFCCPQFNYKYHLPPVVCRGFIFLCCPIMYLYVLSSMVWCPLRFPHKTMIDSSLPQVVCRRAHVFFLFFCIICVCLRILVSNTYCVVFLLCFSSFCVPNVVSFSGLSFLFLLQYFLTFIWIYIFVQYNYHSNEVWILLNISYIK